jgi:hypothetical protein
MTLFEEVVAIERNAIVTELTSRCRHLYFMISWQGMPMLHAGIFDEAVALDFIAQKALQAPEFAADSDATLEQRIAADDLWLLLRNFYQRAENELARSNIFFHAFVFARRMQLGPWFFENTREIFLAESNHVKTRGNIFSFTPQQFKAIFGDLEPVSHTFLPVKQWFSFGKVDPASERWLANREMLEDAFTAAQYRRNVTLEQRYICISKDPKSQIDLIVTVIKTSNILESLALSIAINNEHFARIIDAIKQSRITNICIMNHGKVINPENLLKFYELINVTKTIKKIYFRDFPIIETFPLLVDTVAKSSSLQHLVLEHVELSQANVDTLAANVPELCKLTLIELSRCNIEMSRARSLLAAIYQYPCSQTYLSLRHCIFRSQVEEDTFNLICERVAASQTARQARHAMLALAIRSNTAENSTDTTPQPITPAYNFMSRDGDTAVRTRVLRMMLVEPEDTSLVTENPWLTGQARLTNPS